MQNDSSKRDEKSKKADGIGRPDIFELEDWVPFIGKYAFYSAQAKLQRICPENETIIRWLEEFDQEALTYFDNPDIHKRDIREVQFVNSTYPEDQDLAIGILRLIRKAILLGPDEGKKILIGDKSEDSLNKILQSERARKPRRVTLKNLITKILIDFPGISRDDVLRKLENLTGQGVIDSIDDESILWNDEKGLPQETRITSLPSMISRLKKNL